MQILDPGELTGRARTHVIDLAEPRCTLHREVIQPFLALRAAAAAEGLDLVPASAFRDFGQQLAIWNGKFRGERPLLSHDGARLDAATMSPSQIVAAILCWSALPGASRHHWGTEIDVLDRNALVPGQRAQLIPSEFAPGGTFERLEHWLRQHCGVFGFFRPYDRDRGGVQPEPWHLSYAPIAHAALPALTLEVLDAALADAALDGRSVVRLQLPDIYQRYVLAVAAPSAQALACANVNRAATPS